MIRTFFAAALVAGAFTAGSATLAPDTAHAQGCGWYAFAGATRSFAGARRLANQRGGRVLSIDNSNSPNAGRGMWTIGIGPTSRSAAASARNRYQSRGYSSYIKNMCFYG